MKVAEMELQVENLGPVKKGTMKITPVTVLIGKNNTGKSYTAQMLYAILQGGVGIRNYPIRELKALAKKDEDFRGVREKLFNVLRNSVETNLEEQIKQNVKEVFGPLRTLVRVGSKNLNVRFRNPQMEVRVNLQKTDASLTPSGLSALRRRTDEFFRPNREPYDYLNLMMSFMRSLAPNTYILPAERAAFTRLLRVLLRAFYTFAAVPSRMFGRIRLERERLAALGLAERGEKVPALTLDLFNTFLATRSTDTFTSELKALELVMEGRILEESKTFGIWYEHKHGPRVELQAASSGVAELAPLYLMVQKTLTTDSLLIFEEPEAHLHPGAQVLLARFIARLARRGVRIVLTTHSTLLPIALVHLVGMSAMSIEKRRKMGYNKNEYLTKEELALYHFRWDGQGTIIDPIKIDHTGRVPALPGMADVIDSLYGEEAKLIELSSLDSSKSS